MQETTRPGRSSPLERDIASFTKLASYCGDRVVSRTDRMLFCNNFLLECPSVIPFECWRRDFRWGSRGQGFLDRARQQKEISHEVPHSCAYA